MNHECYGCGRSFENNSGQVVRRNGKYICVSCYSQSADGLSNAARIQRQIRLAGGMPVWIPRSEAPGLGDPPVIAERARLAKAKAAKKTAVLLEKVKKANAVINEINKPVPKSVRMSEAARIETVGEPILFEDDEISF